MTSLKYPNAVSTLFHKIKLPKIPVLLVPLLVIGLSGCQSPNLPKTNTPNGNITEHNEATNKLPNSQAFSSKDLIYFVMTDRYKDGLTENNQFTDVNKNDPKSFHGGDFVGLTQSLDYIKSLGTTAIWITPIVQNEPKGYHGYWAYDFNKIDPHLGTEDEFIQLVNEAHKRDIKVILDYVVNHTGPQSPWVKDASKKDWFHPKKDISNWADLKEVENNWLFGLPDLNTENPEVVSYMTENAKEWIRKTGIDGMRLDTVRHVPRPFWNTFTQSIKTEFPNFYFIGEVWNDNTRYMQLYNDEGIDGLTNYSLYKGITGTFCRTGSSSSLIGALDKEKFFKSPNLNGIFKDNHDNPRYISVNGKAYTKQALTFIMTYPAIPMIYYGTEIGMAGKGDPDNRRDMTWDKTQNNQMLDYYQALLKLRQENLSTTEGLVTAYKTSTDILVYEVIKDKKGLLVIMNLRSKPLQETVALPAKFAIVGDPLQLISEGDGIAELTQSELNLQLSPNQIMVFQITH